VTHDQAINLYDGIIAAMPLIAIGLVAFAMAVLPARRKP
jgi:hypothetical protein